VVPEEPPDPKRLVKRLLREPTLHFFALGALLFLLHHLIVGDPRTIVVTPGVRAAVARRFQDHAGRPPTPAEAEAALADWKREEALYREALREGLDRDDATVRGVLVDKMRARAALEAPRHDPTDAELEQWLADHRASYDSPPRYDLEWVVFPRSQPASAQQRDAWERAVRGGADPKGLGRPIFGATVTADDARERFGYGLSERVRSLPLGAWQRDESPQDLLLVRLSRVEGGPATLNEVRPRLAADYALAARDQTVARAAQAIADRYRYEERK
jgi:hypothetical protein